MQSTKEEFGLRALIIEDSDDDARLLVTHLQRFGYQVKWHRVASPDALRSALKETWDIVFSDYTMPEFNGLDALALIREHDPDLPFVFVSGTIGEERAVAGMKAGAQDYVMKDNLNRLVPAVEREIAEARERRTRRETEKTVRKLSRVVEQATDSVFITRCDGEIRYVNPAFEALTGYVRGEVLGKTPAILKSGSHDDAFYSRLWETIIRGETFRGIVVNRRKNGQFFYEEKTITPLRDDRDDITHFVSTGRDITQRILIEKERARLVDILEATTDVVAIVDPSGKLQYLNGAGRRLLRVAKEEDISSCNVANLYTENALQDWYEHALDIARSEGQWLGETELQDHERGPIPVSQVMLVHRNDDSSIDFFSIIARDISERKRFEVELEHRATHDGLSGLPNRVLLVDRLSSELHRAERQKKHVAVLFLDVDNFKRVNDSLGHAIGDELLRQVGYRIRQALRPSDTVARYGGDEFVIVIGDLAEAQHVLVVLQKLQRAFEAPYSLEGSDIFVSFSTGIAVYPTDGEDEATLLKNADTALYKAKADGKGGYCFYARQMNARGHELLALESQLRRALEREEFRLHYQPQLHLGSGRIVSMEALLRWEHPVRGTVGPADFLPLLEETGLIVPTGEWVLRQACKDLRSLQVAGADDLRVAVNVAARQFMEGAFPDTVRRVLSEEQLEGRMLELEITENTVMKDVHRAAECLRTLDSLGVRLAVDDFGTGYSSLAYLKRFPIDALKIDRAFIKDLPRDQNDVGITEASITLGHKLGLEIVAEGVETDEQLAFLREADCDLIQGYHVSRPVALSALSEWLKGIYS